MCGLSLVCSEWGLLFVALHGLPIAVTSRCRAWAPGARASVAVACRQELRLRSHGTWAQLLHDTWNLPGPGIKPVFLALAGRFLTTRPPGKPQGLVLIEYGEICRYENECHEGRNLYSQISRRASVGQEAEEGRSMT